MKGPRQVVRRVLGCVLGAGLVAATFLACSSGGSRPRGGAQPLYAWQDRSDYGMVSSGSVEATRAGVAVLERGGNAVDAAVAAAFALGVSDPGGSGLGGATYMLISQADGAAVAIDGSTPVPIAADPGVIRARRESGDYYGYTAVSVPTTAATLGHALARYGTMQLAEVLEPAIEIAAQGYSLSNNSVVWARSYLDEILASPYLRFVVLDNGTALGRPGTRVCRPDLRTTLERLAREGVAAFSNGSIGAEIIADMAANGGFVRPADLAHYRPRELVPLQSSYRGAEITAFPLPGGGAEVVEALNIMQALPSTVFEQPTYERLHGLIEAARIAHADHMAHIVAGGAAGGDLRPPHLSERHARERAELITPGRAIPAEVLAPAGKMPVYGDHTTHVSVVDRDGTMVSLTQTLCRVYGAKVATPGLGFPYNCCLEFLDLENPASPFFLRPRGVYPTGMTPVILRTGGSATALGGAGSDRILSTLIDVISNLVDRDMGLREAVTAPRVLWNSAHDPPRVCLEIADPIREADADRLERAGFAPMYRFRYPPGGDANLGFFGGVNAVTHDLRSGTFTGVGDPRRGGFALGPRVVADAAERSR